MKSYKVTLQAVASISLYYEEVVEAESSGEAMDIAICRVPRTCIITECVTVEGQKE